jgi:antitoxin component YwqK of YwqJK toxin-antitoxin module
MNGACEGKSASKLIKFATVGFVVLLLVGCNNYYSTHNIYIKNGLIYKEGELNPFTGRVLDTLENKIVEYDVVEGLKNGEFCVSDLNGIFTVSGAIENNKNVGTWSYFYENGQLESRGNFKNDLPHGKWQWFYKDGTIKSEGYFINGIQEGEWKSFTEHGLLNSITRFAGGKITNKFIVNKNLSI